MFPASSTSCRDITRRRFEKKPALSQAPARPTRRDLWKVEAEKTGLPPAFFLHFLSQYVKKYFK